MHQTSIAARASRDKTVNLEISFIRDKSRYDRVSAYMENLPKSIRVSLGSAIVLKILRGKLDAMPTTAYLLTYKRGKCAANCSFCPQARGSKGRSDMLSRVSWPAFPTRHILRGMRRAVGDGWIKRICLQALNYPGVFGHLLALVKTIGSEIQVPTSISCQPLDGENIKKLAEAKAERICIPLDAATEEIFNEVKGYSVGGPYVWQNQTRLLSQAVDIFGRRKVTTHLIVGLGETEREMVETIQKCVDTGVVPALFAFTPIPGTVMENTAQPSLRKYRRVQFARHLIYHEITRCDHIKFDEQDNISSFGISKEKMKAIIRTGEPFLTSGCPDCNRPYYNEKPGGPIYNYPKPLVKVETRAIYQVLATNQEGANVL